jgi:hypothetical protein
MDFVRESSSQRAVVWLTCARIAHRAPTGFIKAASLLPLPLVHSEFSVSDGDAECDFLDDPKT